VHKTTEKLMNCKASEGKTMKSARESICKEARKFLAVHFKEQLYTYIWREGTDKHRVPACK
jgi:uncharacterized protein YpmB